MTLPARLLVVDPDQRLGTVVSAVSAPLPEAALVEAGFVSRRPIHQWAADGRRLHAVLAASLREPHWLTRVYFHDKTGLLFMLEPRPGGIVNPAFSQPLLDALQFAVARSQAAADSRARAAKPAAVKTVVLVDDDRMVRAVCRRWLQDRYFVVEAASSAAALAVADWLPWSADLLISDVNLPVTDGIALAEQWLRRWPPCRILLLSGSYVPEAASHLPALFLQKPFPSDELLRCAEVLLGHSTTLQRPA